jgi:transcriptional regulator with XRE-family HTH domain
MQINDIDKIIGQNLRRLRKQKGLSQEQLGVLINNPPTKISALENAKEGMGKDIMSKICTALKIRPFQFYIEPTTPIIINQDEITILKTMRTTPDLKPVLLKISEAYTDTENITGDDPEGEVHEDNKISKEEVKRRTKESAA